MKKILKNLFLSLLLLSMPTCTFGHAGVVSLGSIASGSQQFLFVILQAAMKNPGIAIVASGCISGTVFGGYKLYHSVYSSALMKAITKMKEDLKNFTTKAEDLKNFTTKAFEEHFKKLSDKVIDEFTKHTGLLGDRVEKRIDFVDVQLVSIQKTQTTLVSSQKKTHKKVENTEKIVNSIATDQKELTNLVVAGQKETVGSIAAIEKVVAESSKLSSDRHEEVTTSVAAVREEITKELKLLQNSNEECLNELKLLKETQDKTNTQVQVTGSQVQQIFDVTVVESLQLPEVPDRNDISRRLSNLFETQPQKKEKIAMLEQAQVAQIVASEVKKQFLQQQREQKTTQSSVPVVTHQAPVTSGMRMTDEQLVAAVIKGLDQREKERCFSPALSLAEDQAALFMKEMQKLNKQISEMHKAMYAMQQLNVGMFYDLCRLTQEARVNALKYQKIAHQAFSGYNLLPIQMPSFIQDSSVQSRENKPKHDFLTIPGSRGKCVGQKLLGFGELHS